MLVLEDRIFSLLISKARLSPFLDCLIALVVHMHSPSFVHVLGLCCHLPMKMLILSFTIIQGTAAGGTMEIVVNGTTGLLHPAGKEGVTPLANNIVKLATHVERRLTMGKKGYERVKDRFLEHHMSQRIALVLREVLQYAKIHQPESHS